MQQNKFEHEEGGFAYDREFTTRLIAFQNRLQNHSSDLQCPKLMRSHRISTVTMLCLLLGFVTFTTFATSKMHSLIIDGDNELNAIKNSKAHNITTYRNGKAHYDCISTPVGNITQKEIDECKEYLANYIREGNYFFALLTPELILGVFFLVTLGFTVSLCQLSKGQRYLEQPIRFLDNDHEKEWKYISKILNKELKDVRLEKIKHIVKFLDIQIKNRSSSELARPKSFYGVANSSSRQQNKLVACLPHFFKRFADLDTDKEEAIFNESSSLLNDRL